MLTPSAVAGQPPRTSSVADRRLCLLTSLVGLALALVAVIQLAASPKHALRASDAARDSLSDAVLNGSFLTFFALGDWGREGSPAQRQVADSMGAWAQSTNPAFVVSVGDNYYPNGVSSTSDPLWQRSFTEVYTHPGLATTPWYAVAGNHDYRSNVKAQVGWNGDARWHMPALNYTLYPHVKPSHNGSSDSRACAALVFIDTVPLIQSYHSRPESTGMAMNLLHASVQGQVTWFKEQLALASATCDAVIVVGHHPVYSGAEHGNSPDLKMYIEGAMAHYNVSAYLAGHDHMLSHLVFSDIDFIVTGAGSDIRQTTVATPETRWFADVGGFTVHSVNTTHMRHAFVGATGELLHVTERALAR